MPHFFLILFLLPLQHLIYAQACPSYCENWYGIVCISNNTDKHISQLCPFGCNNGGNQCKVLEEATCTRLKDVTFDWCSDVKATLWSYYRPDIYYTADDNAKNNYQALNAIRAFSPRCEIIVKKYTCASMFWGCNEDDDAETCGQLCADPCLDFFPNCKLGCYNVNYPVEDPDLGSEDDESSDNNLFITIVLALVLSIMISIGVLMVATACLNKKKPPDLESTIHPL